MDPLTILGAAAASAQMASYAVKGVLRTAQLFKEINHAPSQALDLLSYIEREATAVNRLLRPDSPVFSQLSTSQYAQLCPYAIDARKALEAVQKVLQALEDDHKNPEGKLVPRVWKSIITAKVVRDIESDLKVIERLNASLIRELNVSGFETQSVLRGQSEQILELASVSSARADVAYESLDLTSTLQTQAIENVSKSITSFSQGLDTVRQEGSNHHGTLKQSIDSTKVELADVRQDLGVLKSNSEIANVTVTDIKSMVSGQSIVLKSLMEIKNKELVELIREKSRLDRTAFLADVRNELCTQLMRASAPYRRTPQELTRTGDSVFEVNLTAGTATYSSSAIPPVGQINRGGPTYSLTSPWKCTCRQGRTAKVWTYGRMGFRVEKQNIRHCLAHGKVHSWSYAIQAKLGPWLNGVLEFTLGLQRYGHSWSPQTPLKFRATVKRGDSLLFKLFDEFVATCPQIQIWEPELEAELSDAVVCRQAKGYRLLLWNKEATERHMARLVRSIREVISSGRASGSDVDEQGHTLLMEVFYLIFLFRNDANHYSIYLMDLLELGRISQVDPMAVAPMNYAYSPTVLNAPPKPTKSTAYYLFYVIEFSNLSDQFVARIMEQYDGIIDSLGEQEQDSWRWGSLKLFTHHPSIAKDWGYSRQRLAIIRRSLADLRDSCSEDDVRYNDRFHFSCMELAIEFAEIRSESHESATQLEQLMEIYKMLRVALIEVPLEKFWMIWWDIADEIVLPLLKEEACKGGRPVWSPLGPPYLDAFKAEKAQKRVDRWAVALKNAGYRGWNFEDVIKVHFAPFLLHAEAYRQRKLSFKRHRRMTKPKVNLRMRAYTTSWM
ncbi:putative Fungal N-terminal domain-containing protein [Seiridium cardinale]|uniref:Fungal N-terminal domain-containing protein n=1 Tax=Seiridium cardinale TaxID=138064 RepID=A0ABR2Y9P1_9PEZI